MASETLMLRASQRCLGSPMIRAFHNVKAFPALYAYLCESSSARIYGSKAFSGDFFRKELTTSLALCHNTCLV